METSLHSKWCTQEDIPCFPSRHAKRIAFTDIIIHNSGKPLNILFENPEILIICYNNLKRKKIIRAYCSNNSYEKIVQFLSIELSEYWWCKKSRKPRVYEFVTKYIKNGGKSQLKSDPNLLITVGVELKNNNENRRQKKARLLYVSNIHPHTRRGAKRLPGEHLAALLMKCSINSFGNRLSSNLINSDSGLWIYGRADHPILVPGKYFIPSITMSEIKAPLAYVLYVRRNKAKLDNLSCDLILLIAYW